MPLQREPIFHDRQAVSVAGPLTTTSSTFVDIPGATLTTKDLGSPGFYQAWLSAQLQHTNNNQTITIRVVVDGTPTAGRTISFGPNSAGNPQSISLIGESAGIAAGSIVKLQWLTSAATAQINDLIMMIDGIPDIRVVT